MSRVKTPYLIQRATICEPLADENTRLSKAVDFDYMGSAEFEFGALPAAFRRIHPVLDSWSVRNVDGIYDAEHTLIVCSSFSDDEFEEYKKHLAGLRSGKIRTKESTYFNVGHSKHFRSLRCNFWWDIDNDAMFSFDAKFMERLKKYVEASLHYMDEQRKDAA